MRLSEVFFLLVWHRFGTNANREHRAELVAHRASRLSQPKYGERSSPTVSSSASGRVPTRVLLFPVSAFRISLMMIVAKAMSNLGAINQGRCGSDG